MKQVRGSMNWKIWVVLSLVAVLVAGLALAPTVFRAVKDFRAAQLAGKAAEQEADGELRPAYQSYFSAHQLSPNDQQYLLKLAELGREINHPLALQWFENAFSMDPSAVDQADVVAYIELGLRRNEPERVRPLLLQYIRENPEALEVRSQQVRLLRRDNLNEQALELARELLEQGADVESLHADFVELSLQSGDPEVREQGQEHLEGLVGRQDRLGLAALRMKTRMVFNNLVSMDELPGLLEGLTSHPEKEVQDALLAITARIDLLEEPLDQALARAEAWMDLEDPESRNLYISWLNSRQFFDASLAFFDLDNPPTESTAFFNFCVALIGAGRPQDAIDLTTAGGADANPLSPAQGFTVRGMASKELGDADAHTRSMELAAQTARLEEASWVENLLVAEGFGDLVPVIYENLLENPQARFFAQNKLIPIYYQLGRETDLEALVETMSLDQYQALPSWPGNATGYIYFRLLFGQDIPAIRNELEAISSRNPRVADFRLLLGFAYLLSGRGQEALTIYEGVTDRLAESGNRPYRLAAAAVYLAGNNREEAERVVGDLDLQSILPTEKLLVRPLLL